MNYDEILAQVKVALDEVDSLDGGLIIEDNGNNPIDNLIAGLLDSAWRSFVFVAPLHLLPTKNITTVSISSLVAVVAKPADFIRLSSFKLSSWARQIIEAYPYDSAMYSIQKNVFTRAGINRPVVIITPTTIEGYSASSANDTLDMNYVSAIVFDPTSEASIVPANIAQAFCYHVAGMVYSSLSSQAANVMFANRDGLCA